MAIQLIQSIHATHLNQVTQYYPFPQGRVQIQSKQWTELPMHPASSDMTTSSRSDAAGTSYTTGLSARLKENVIFHSPVILKITLCSGKEYILGSPDIPVAINSSTPLTVASISVNHTTYHPPLELSP